MAIRFKGKEISSIVLDFDGTFYQTDDETELRIWDGIRRAMVSKFFEYRGETDVDGEKFEQLLEDFIQLAGEIGWKPAFIQLGGNSDDFVEIISTVSLAEHLAFDQQLVDLLNELIQHVPVYIFTGSNRKRVFDALEVLIGDLKQIFVEGRVLAADDMKNGLKPDEAAYSEMIERFEIEDSGSTIFVDDQETEVTSAERLGLITFWIQANGGPKKDHPHVIISSILEITNHLEID